MRWTCTLFVILMAGAACGDDDGGVDGGLPDARIVDGSASDGSASDGSASDAAMDASLADAAPDASPGPDSAVDASPGPDSAVDASPGPDAASDASITRTTIYPGFCPSSNTAAGYYQGTLASNLNDINTNNCTGASPGRDGALRVELAPGQTVTAVYRHDGDGILYILDSCPVTTSCLDGSDSSMSGAETVTYTNSSGTANPVYIVLDSDSVSGPQTFELDLFVTP